MLHTVLPNESLFTIALQYQIPLLDLMQYNNLNSGVVEAGQELLIPDSVVNTVMMRSFSTRQTYTVVAGDTLWSIATKLNVGIDLLKKENNLTSNALTIGQILQIPTTGNPSTNVSDNPMNTNVSTQTVIHTVAAGESLWSIAKKYGDTVDAVKARNQLASNSLFIGQKLTLLNTNNINTGNNNAANSGNNTTADQWYTVKAGDTLNLISFIFDATVADLRRWNNLPNDILRIGQQLIVKKATTVTPPPPPPTNNTNNNTPPPPTNNTNNNPIYYTVQAGDGLWGIASRYNVQVTDLRRWNNLNNDNLSIGQRLIVGYQNNGGNGGNGNVTPPSDTNDTNVTVNIPVNNPLVFNYAVNITDTVGNNGKNIASDVKRIQERLNRLGFLDNQHFNNERPFNADTQPVSGQYIPQTIAAIRAFQSAVIPALTNPDGQIRPNHASLMFLNSAIIPPTPDQVQQILQARTEFRMEEASGIVLLGNGLTAPVGSTNFGNQPDDVRKVQQRLENLNILRPNSHQETPPNGATEAIPQAQLTKTIQAIKKFQEQYVSFWRDKPNLVIATNYVDGVVGKDSRDITFTILKDFTEYKVTLPASTGGGNIVAVFRTHVESAYTISTKGVSYFGQVSPENLTLQEYQSIGLNTVQAKALKFVSEHEGKFDALNTYDKANFSFGFIQFAGGDGGLSPMIGFMKYLYPKTFQNYFQKYGIDVEYAVNEAQGQVSTANLVVITDAGQVLRRTDAELHLRDNKLLCAIFVNAAYQTEVQKAQIESAKRKFVVPALNIRINLNLPVVRVLAADKNTVSTIYVGNEADAYKRKSDFTTLKSQGRIKETSLTLTNHPIAELIRSEKGITTLIDSTVNQWIVRTAAYFTAAISTVAADDSLDTIEKLRNINERKVLDHISQNADSRIRQRTANILAAGTLSLNKGNV